MVNSLFVAQPLLYLPEPDLDTAMSSSLSLAQTQQWKSLAPTAVNHSQPVRKGAGGGAKPLCVSMDTMHSRLPNSKSLAMEALSRGEGPGSLAGDPRRG